MLLLLTLYADTARRADASRHAYFIYAYITLFSALPITPFSSRQQPRDVAAAAVDDAATRLSLLFIFLITI